ncbi:MAG: hypothetical protein NWF14_03480 [Candidatus Bathyarchaeota archaeon]|nr:hypothetical protein [Candidatus Bathyarchaeota archaeon]
MYHRIEIWKRYEQVEVARDVRGRFLYWQRIIFGKQAAVYGHARMGIRGRVSSQRYEFHGQGRDLYHAVVLALDYPPRRRFVTVSAKEFISYPFKYGGGGYWVDEPEVES